jgi:hypothetical protein
MFVEVIRQDFGMVGVVYVKGPELTEGFVGVTGEAA